MIVNNIQLNKFFARLIKLKRVIKFTLLYLPSKSYVTPIYLCWSYSSRTDLQRTYNGLTTDLRGRWKILTFFRDLRVQNIFSRENLNRGVHFCPFLGIMPWQSRDNEACTPPLKCTYEKKHIKGGCTQRKLLVINRQKGKNKQKCTPLSKISREKL